MNATENLNLTSENQRKLKELVFAIKASDGIFSLLIAVCDDLQLRERLIKSYEEKLQDKLHSYHTKLSRKKLSLRLALQELVEQNSALQQGQRAVITVTGAEDLLFVQLKGEKSEIEEFFGYLQWTREGLREFRYPIVLWVTQQIFIKLSSQAPDFWSWRKGVFQFASPTPVNTALSFPKEQSIQFADEQSFDDDLPLEDLEDLIAKTVTQRGEKDPLLASLYYRLGRLYSQRLQTGRFLHLRDEQQKAIDSFNKAIKIQSELGLSLGLAQSLDSLAKLYQHLGKYELAEQLYKQALELCQRLLGQDHPDVATSLNNLASLYRSQGRYSEAEPLYKQALELRQRLLGQDHPDVVTSLNNLASLYESQGRYSEAEPLYKQALELCQRLLGQDHPDVATSLNNLASLYKSQGRYSEAEPLYKQALELRQGLLGQDHPDVATSLNNLAGLYESQGRYSEAEPLCKQALEIGDRTLGSNHPNTVTIRENLAILHENMLVNKSDIAYTFSP